MNTFSRRLDFVFINVVIKNVYIYCTYTSRMSHFSYGFLYFAEQFNHLITKSLSDTPLNSAAFNFSVHLLSKPPDERNEEDILAILTKIRHTSTLFKNLEEGRNSGQFTIEKN